MVHPFSGDIPEHVDLPAHGMPLARAYWGSALALPEALGAWGAERLARVLGGQPGGYGVSDAALAARRSVMEQLQAGALRAFGRPDDASRPASWIMPRLWTLAELPMAGESWVRLGGRTYWDVHVHLPAASAQARGFVPLLPAFLVWGPSVRPRAPAVSPGPRAEMPARIAAAQREHHAALRAAADAWLEDEVAAGRVKVQHAEAGPVLRLPAHPAPPSQAEAPGPRARIGRPPRHDWEQVRRDLGAWLHANGLPGTQAEAERWMAGKFPPDDQPAPSEIRKHVGDVMRAHRKALGVDK